MARKDSILLALAAKELARDFEKADALFADGAGKCMLKQIEEWMRSQHEDNQDHINYEVGPTTVKIIVKGYAPITVAQHAERLDMLYFRHAKGLNTYIMPIEGGLHLEHPDGSIERLTEATFSQAIANNLIRRS